MQRRELLLLAGAVTGAILALYAETCHMEPVILEQIPVTQQEVLAEMVVEVPVGDPIKT